MKLLSFFLMLACLCLGCSQDRQIDLTIGRDQTWFPLQLDSFSVNVTGFSTALVQAIAKEVELPLQIDDTNWYVLYEGLENGKYGGVFSGLSPNAITLSQYDFSDPFLLLGPVLIVRSSSAASSLADLAGGIVGVSQFDDSVLMVQEYPSINIQTYQHMSPALNDLVEGKIDGVLLGNLEAKTILPVEFADSLRIATPPLGDKAIRVLTLKGKNPLLIDTFNKGLKKVRQKGIYTQLKKNFELPL